DNKEGRRNGSNSNIAVMRMVVEKLTPEDIINITAYLASRPLSPSGKPAPATGEPITSQPNLAKPAGGPVASLQTRWTRDDSRHADRTVHLFGGKVEPFSVNSSACRAVRGIVRAAPTATPFDLPRAVATEAESANGRADSCYRPKKEIAV